jgi:NAD-dependent dihydropyrimidine dehydrogenase PreA subunit
MSRFKEAWRTLIGFSMRLFPLRTETGLRIFGRPDENSPVFVTSNFDLTVKRVSRFLKQLDCYLLVAQSGGVNVWCAATGGTFTEHSIITAIEISRIGSKVKHRTLILPQLSAAGINTKTVKKETGWDCKFGPVYAKDIPEYVNNGFQKTEPMRRVEYPLADRLEVAFGCIFPFYLLIMAFLLIFKRSWIFEFNLVSWSMFLLLFVFQPYYPSKYGWGKVLFVEILIITTFFLYLFFSWGGSAHINGQFVWAIIVTFLMGMDCAGFSPNLKGEVDELMIRMGISNLWILALKGTEKGDLITGVKKFNLDDSKCIGCKLCFDICPLAIFKINKENKSYRTNPEKCTVCRACLVQCPTGAISLIESR